MLLAFVLLTRLPLPHLPDAAFAQAGRAVWAYPLVGVVVGFVGWIAGDAAAALALPPMVCAALAVGAMMMLTGAMHEDGLADLFDGFWGGMTSERRLDIMRDSQIGTYGVLSLLMVTLVRLAAIVVLLPMGAVPLIAAASLSRAAMPVVMATLSHARTDGLSRSVGTVRRGDVVAGLILGAVVAVICAGVVGLVLVGLVLGVAAALRALSKAKIGGQTGDVLGATQQLAEATVLLGCIALL
ncbi:adenosylcobinamide-GDP ribazoletransferase [Sulfitobacter sp. S190]|nr:adenosylcobinamide-GDP ribazoletransferase [Sulfitobacter sp. S190]